MLLAFVVAAPRETLKKRLLVVPATAGTHDF
jgi:hypothetical protein